MQYIDFPNDAVIKCMVPGAEKGHPVSLNTLPERPSLYMEQEMEVAGVTLMFRYV
jgi:hypothetical protein